MLSLPLSFSLSLFLSLALFLSDSPLSSGIILAVAVRSCESTSRYPGFENFRVCIPAAAAKQPLSQRQRPPLLAHPRGEVDCCATFCRISVYPGDGSLFLPSPFTLLLLPSPSRSCNKSRRGSREIQLMKRRIVGTKKRRETHGDIDNETSRITTIAIVS